MTENKKMGLYEIIICKCRFNYFSMTNIDFRCYSSMNRMFQFYFIAQIIGSLVIALEILFSF